MYSSWVVVKRCGPQQNAMDPRAFIYVLSWEGNPGTDDKYTPRENKLPYITIYIYITSSTTVKNKVYIRIV